MEPDASDTTEGQDEVEQDRLEALLIECLDRAETEGPEAIEVFCRSHPEHAGALKRQLAILEGLSLVDGKPAEDAAGLPVGRIGEFRLLRKLGEGGMGVVYLAEQTSLRRLVALKVLRAGAGAPSGLAARFQREALAIAKLRHPNIVGLHAAGEESGVRWLAMELVPGRGLDEILSEAVPRAGNLPIPQVVRWGRDLANALDAAHAAGIVHRDLKPSNVRITPEGQAMLLDFGLARDIEAPHLTRTGEFQGSPHYASPEQIGGGAELIGPPSDVYSLGVTLYEAATGALPFTAETTEQLFQRILTQEPLPARKLNPAVPRDLETVLLRAMAKDPRRRYPGAAALAADLDAILGLRPIAARRPGPILRLLTWARRHPGAAAAVLTATAAALLLVGILVAQAGAARDRARDEARVAIEDANRLLGSFRSNRVELAAAAHRVARLRHELQYNYIDPRRDEQLDRDEAAVERGRREREMVLVQVLALLQRAEGLDPGNAEARRLRAGLYAEKFDEASNALDAGLASFYRDLVLSIDPGSAAARRVTGRVEVSITTGLAGAEVHLFRYRTHADVVLRGEPRLVPVPEAGPDPVVPPGTWCLRVVRGAGSLRPGDLIVAVDGHPVRGTMFAWTRESEGEPPELLVAADGTPVADAWDAGSRNLRGLTPAALCERGGVEATIFHEGRLRTEVLPPGLRVRTTAAPVPLSRSTLAGTTPMPPIVLEPGSYLAVLRLAGFEDLRYPFRIGEFPKASFAIAMNPEGATPEGFVFVPTFPKAWAKAPFWIQEREVTAGEYLEFLNDPETLETVASTPARILVPREGSEPLWPGGGGGGFRLGPAWTPEWPVFGISFEDAEAFARWRTAREAAAGRSLGFALPDFDEWRTSGHGADGRDYVFGWVFRPKWMKSNYARPKPGPEPGLRFPVDESVFGAFDLSGSVLEWVDDWYREPDLRRVAGGAWGQADPGSYFLVEGGLGLTSESVANMVGFRLVARPGAR